MALGFAVLIPSSLVLRIPIGDGVVVVKVKHHDALRQLEASKAIEDALQSELNTTLAAYAQSKEGNQKLIQVQHALDVDVGATAAFRVPVVARETVFLR